jgi:hypothetical protein
MRALPFKFNAFAAACFLCFAFSCKRPLPPDETGDNLKAAWLTYLQHQPNYDSTRVKFEVVNVAFFNDPKYYICTFKVRMQVPSKAMDTVGTMTGTVSHDFLVVHRKY